MGIIIQVNFYFFLASFSLKAPFSDTKPLSQLYGICGSLLWTNILELCVAPNKLILASDFFLFNQRIYHTCNLHYYSLFGSEDFIIRGGEL